MSEWTIDLAIVCSTSLLALGMFRSSVRTVAEQRKHFVFDLKLPLKIRWRFAASENGEQGERLIAATEIIAPSALPAASIALDVQSLAVPTSTTVGETR